MWEKQNSSIEVLFSFTDGYTRPVHLTWQDESYDLGGVQFWYAEHKNGGARVHHYTVSDKAGNYEFILALETENLTWKLEKAKALATSPWHARGLVGAV